MALSEFWSKETREWLESLPGRKRRWEITVFRNDLTNSGVNQVLVEHFTNASSHSIDGCVSVKPGVLHFLDERGKEIVVSNMPFIARETTPDPSEGQSQ